MIEGRRDQEAKVPNRVSRVYSLTAMLLSGEHFSGFNVLRARFQLLI
jgi:hypothetical protein